MTFDRDLRSIQQAREIAAKAKEAQQEFAGFSLVPGDGFDVDQPARQLKKVHAFVLFGWRAPEGRNRGGEAGVSSLLDSAPPVLSNG